MLDLISRKKDGLDIAVSAVSNFATAGWVSVNDKKPELEKSVLLQFPRNMAVGRLEIGYWQVSCGDDDWEDITDEEPQPTHWTELPVSPS